MSDRLIRLSGFAGLEAEIAHGAKLDVHPDPAGRGWFVCAETDAVVTMYASQPGRVKFFRNPDDARATVAIALDLASIPF